MRWPRTCSPTPSSAPCARAAASTAGAAPPNWLYAIALNLLRDHAAERGGGGPGAGSGRRRAGGAATRPSGLERRDALERALRGLSAEEREAIALRFGAELTVPEMARCWASR